MELYHLKIIVSPEKSNYCNVAKIENLKVWHERLSHQNVQYIRSYLKNSGVIYKDIKDFFCDACTLGKQHRLPFGKSENPAKYAGEIISADVCGPM